MKIGLIALVIMIIMVLSEPVSAAESNFGYKFIITANGVTAKSAENTFKGVLKSRQGIFSEWHFDTEGQYEDLHVIVNQRRKLVIYADSEPCGMRLYNASKNNSYVIVEDACAINGANFVVYDSTGKQLLESDFQAKAVWRNDYELTYERIDLALLKDSDAYSASLTASRDNPAVKAKCGDNPAAIAEWVSYNFKTATTTKLDRPTDWICID